MNFFFFFFIEDFFILGEKIKKSETDLRDDFLRDKYCAAFKQNQLVKTALKLKSFVGPALICFICAANICPQNSIKISLY